MPFKIAGRAKAWKEFVELSIADLTNDVARIDGLIRDASAFVAHAKENASALVARIEKMEGHLGQGDHLSRDVAQLLAALEGLDQSQRAMVSRLETVVSELETRDSLECVRFENAVIKPLRQQLGGEMIVGPDYEVLLTTRGTDLLALFLPRGDAERIGLAGIDGQEAIGTVVEGHVASGFVVTPGVCGRFKAHRADAFLAGLELMPSHGLAWSKRRAPRQTEPTAAGARVGSATYFDRLKQILDNLDCIDFHALGAKRDPDARLRNVPFDQRESLPRFAPAEPRRRSLVLLHNNYYHFNCLADGLKKRGWDALTVSLESPDSPQQQFFHGEDVNLFDPDPTIMARKTRDFFRTVPERFENLHFCGQGYPTFFPANIENSPEPHAIPWDFLELRRHRTLIGYMPSGCTDGGLQSSIRELTGGLCSRCVWELRPDVCSDARSLAWNRKLALLCDWVGLEGDHATPERIGPRTVYGPVVTTLDPARWGPEIAVPDDMRIEREPGEILVYHAVGNYATRRVGDRDIKGTGAVLAAIEQLKNEGFPVRLVFAHDVPSTRVRFLQVQADIVVDQLNYGRYGANAREAMMLGRPTLCRLSPRQAAPLPALRPIQEAPMLDAGEDTVVDVLRSLVLDRERRVDLGRRARDYAVAWHGMDACAERYEKVVDRVRAGLPPESADLYPA